MRHHTKDKGDIGVVYANADLIEKGHLVLLPLTEHAPFDLVAYRDESFLRVQVKYRKAVKGVVSVSFRSIWADQHGAHVRPMNKNDVDVVAIYCPDTRTCYYVDPKKHGGSVALRIAPTLNNNEKNILWAKNYLEIPASVKPIPAGVEFRGRIR